MRSISKFIFLLAFLLLTPLSGSAQDSQDTALLASGNLAAHRFKPCSYWRRSAQGNYTCSNPAGVNVTVPDAYSLRDLLEGMQNRIKELEQRIEELEGR